MRSEIHFPGQKFGHIITGPLRHLALATAVKQIRELQRLLGKKTMENESLKEAVECGQSRKWIAHTPWLPKDKE